MPSRITYHYFYFTILLLFYHEAQLLHSWTQTVKKKKILCPERFISLSFLMRKELNVNLRGTRRRLSHGRSGRGLSSASFYTSMTGGCHSLIWPAVDLFQLLLSSSSVGSGTLAKQVLWILPLTQQQKHTVVLLLLSFFFPWWGDRGG